MRNVRQLLKEQKAWVRLLNRSISHLPVRRCQGGILVKRTIDLSYLHRQNVRSFSLSCFNGQQQQNKSDESGKKSSSGDDKKPDEDEYSILRKAFVWAAISATLTVFFLISTSSDGNLPPLISWNEFLYNMLNRGEVEEILIQPDRNSVLVILADGAVVNGRLAEHRAYRLQVPNVGKFEEQLRRSEKALGISPEAAVSVVYERSYDSSWLFVFALIAFSLMLMSMFRGGQIKISGPMDIMGQFRKAKFRLVDPLGKSAASAIRFKDVAGLHEAKVEIKEFVDYLRNPQAFTSLGAKLPKGALMTGPPGCGKTLLAKAVATESSVPFLAVNGSEFIEMIGGLGAARVRDLFQEAKTRAPCIIYIDELDALGKRRSDTGSMGGGTGNSSSEEEQTLNQLLVEMDGMDTNQNVIILASTNRPEVLDKALLRRGRFDRHITIDLPTKLERQELFTLYLKKIRIAFDPAKYIELLANMTPGLTGADINNICNEAALRAATVGKTKVDETDLHFALDKIIAGPEKKSTSMTAEEKQIVAYHECGHAITGWLLQHTDALLKISILPRTTSALGFSQYSPAENKLFTSEQLFDRMVMTLGGRAAENMVFGRISTGAENDLSRVTRLAYDQIRIYGMNTAVGPLSFPPAPGEERQAQFYTKPYSKQLHSLFDQEAYKLITSAYNKAEKLIKANRNNLDKLAAELLRAETLSYDDVKKIIGPPPFGDKHVVEDLFQQLPASSPEPHAVKPNGENQMPKDRQETNFQSLLTPFSQV